jgi:aminopeptidase N
MKLQTAALLLLLSSGTFAAGNPRELRSLPRKAPKQPTAKFDTTHSFDVQSYTLRLTLPMTNDSLYGHQRMTAVSQISGLDTVVLNSVDLSVDSVKQDGSYCGFRLANDSLYAGISPASSGQHFALDIFYRLGGRGTNRSGYYWYPQGGEALRPVGYSMSAPQEARAWMPCFDEPWDKADSGCEFLVTAPAAYKAGANGLLADTAWSGGWLTWQWREDRAIATYLMAFNVSQYAFWSDTARTAAGDTVPLNYFVWQVDSATSRSVFGTVPAMMDCYSSLFGPYPFAKYGMAAVAPFMFGGMENQDMTTIIRSWIQTNDQYGIAHELSHMWFGDMVTCGTWADIWLNEGFGSYCEALYFERITGKKPGAYMVGNFNTALSDSAEKYPIYDPPMALIYEYSMEYAKGAWVLQMLRGVMGDAPFFAAMRAYADSFAYGNAVTADFQRIAERHYGQTLDWFFGQWVYRPGHPRYTQVAFYKISPDSNSARVTVSQQPSVGALFRMPLAIACSTAAGIRTAATVVDTAGFFECLVTDTLPVLQVRLDPDYWVLRQVTDALPQLRSVLMASQQLTPVWRPYTAYSVAGYNVYRSLSASGPMSRVNQDLVTDTSYVDTGLTNGTRYYYAVTAVAEGDTCYETHLSNRGSRIPVGVAGEPSIQEDARALRLEQGSPNPFKQSAMINYQLTKPGLATLKVYNLQGQLVKTLVNSVQPAGRHQARWDGREAGGNEISSGIYFVKLKAGGATITRALQYIK